MCTHGGDERQALSRRGVLLRGGALAAMGLVPALGCASKASAGSSDDAAKAKPLARREKKIAGPPYGRPLTSRYPVSAAYGIPGNWEAGHHTGIDFAVPSGTPLYSVGTGTVEVAGDYGAYGNAVLVRMDDGHFILYAHLSKVYTKFVARVRAGTRIGNTGASGRVTGPHLHFEVRTTRNYGTDTDPVRYLARRGVQLV